MKPDAHMFWAYGDFTRLERICASSFIKSDFNLTIWTYGNGAFVSGANVRDARDIIPEESLFLNKKGSYASFADLFRYTLLSRVGGLYADTDVVCLKNASALPPHQFIVTERTQNGELIVNNNVLYNPSPRDGNLIDLAKQYAIKFPKDNIEWAELGPILLTSLVNSNAMHGFNIYSPEFANNFDHWRCPFILLDSNFDKIPEGAFFIHLYNETWRANNINKDVVYQSSSLYEQLAIKFCNSTFTKDGS